MAIYLNSSRKHRHNNPEWQEQVALARWLRLAHTDVLWTASAGGMRTGMGTAIKMKMAGYSAGCPDILIFEPRKGFHGLAIEFKKDAKYGKAYASKEQQGWIDALAKRGYRATVCRGFAEAVNVIGDYLNGSHIR
jgi:hypothetical protein